MYSPLLSIDIWFTETMCAGNCCFRLIALSTLLPWWSIKWTAPQCVPKQMNCTKTRYDDSHQIHVRLETAKYEPSNGRLCNWRHLDSESSLDRWKCEHISILARLLLRRYRFLDPTNDTNYQWISNNFPIDSLNNWHFATWWLWLDPEHQLWKRTLWIPIVIVPNSIKYIPTISKLYVWRMSQLTNVCSYFFNVFCYHHYFVEITSEGSGDAQRMLNRTKNPISNWHFIHSMGWWFFFSKPSGNRFSFSQE